MDKWLVIRLLLIGVLTGILLWVCHSPALFFWLALFTAAASVLSDIDRRHLLLPDVLTLPLLWCGLLFHLLLLPQQLAPAVIGVIVGYLSLRLLGGLYQLVRRREGLGRGDMKYFAAIGAWTGFAALPIVATLAAALGIISWLVMRKYRDKTTRQPFGPCLSLAGWLVLIAQHGRPEMFNWLV